MRRRTLVSCLLWSVVPGIAIVAGCEDSGSGIPNFNPNFDGGFGFDSGPRPFDASAPPPTVDGKPLVELADKEIDFGAADCQSTPSARSLTFRNAGTAAVTWTATVTGSAFSIAAGQTGAVEPGETGTITIGAAAIPATTKVGAVLEGSLSVTTNALPGPVVIPIKVTAHGASLKVTTSNIGFGQIPIGDAAPEQTLTLENVGDRGATMALGQPTVPEFQVGWAGAPAAGTVEGKGTLAGAVARFTPSAIGTKSTKIGITMSGAVCAGDLPELTLGGEGTTLPVAISPGTVQFGATTCGATATSKAITIKNDYNFPLTYTATMNTGPYQIEPGQGTGTVPAKGQASITVRASAVPAATTSLAAGALAGTMTVSTSAPGATPVAIDLAQSATGAVLTLTPASGSTIAFGNVPSGTPASRAFSLKNDGNVEASVTATATGPGFSASIPATIAATGADVGGTVTLTASQPNTVSGLVTVSTTTPLCQAGPPGALHLTANVQAPLAVVGPVPAMTSTCGVATPTAVSIPVKNDGLTPLTISAASATGGFTVTSAVPFTVPSGGTVNVTVRPPAAVVGTDIGGSSKTGVLTLTTNEIGSGQRTVNLSTGVVGASLRLVDAAGNPISSVMLSSGEWCPEPKDVFIRNVGNASATVSFSSKPSQPIMWDDFEPSSTVAPGATISHSVSAWTYGACTGSTVIDYQATGTMCSLPLALTASINIAGSSSCYCYGGGGGGQDR